MEQGYEAMCSPYEVSVMLLPTSDGGWRSAHFPAMLPVTLGAVPAYRHRAAFESGSSIAIELL